MTNTAKILKFDNSAERKLSVVAERISRGDFLGAMSMLLSLEKQGKNAPDIYAQIASLYFCMQLYPYSAIYWFKFLDKCSKSAKARAYNGIAAAFYMQDDYDIDSFAASSYYFEKQILSDAHNEYEYDYLTQEFFTAYEYTQPDFYICYPEERADGNYFLLRADEAIRKGDNSLAIKQLSKVSASDNAYATAKIKMARVYVKMNLMEEAYETVKQLIKDIPDDIDGLLTALSFLMFSKRREEMSPYFELLEKVEIEEPADLIRLSAIYCEEGMPEKAEKLLTKLLKILPYDINASFMYGQVEYNLAKYTEAEKAFSMAYSITNNEAAAYYMRLSRAAITKKTPKSPKQLEYTLNYPRREIERLVDITNDICLDANKAIKTYGREQIYVLLNWAFSYDNILQSKLVEALIDNKIKYFRNFFIKKLLNPFLSDDIKEFTIEKLAEIGYSRAFGVVIISIYKKLKLEYPTFCGDNADEFKKAYSYACGKMFFTNVSAHSLAKAAQKISSCFSNDEKLKNIKKESISAAMLIAGRAKEYPNSEFIIKTLGAQKKEVDFLLKKSID